MGYHSLSLYLQSFQNWIIDAKAMFNSQRVISVMHMREPLLYNWHSGFDMCNVALLERLPHWNDDNFCDDGGDEAVDIFGRRSVLKKYLKMKQRDEQNVSQCSLESSECQIFPLCYRILSPLTIILQIAVTNSCHDLLCASLTGRHTTSFSKSLFSSLNSLSIYHIYQRQVTYQFYISMLSK